jgi:hypothetical protein
MSEEDRLYRIDRQLGDINDKFDKLIRLEEKHLALSNKVDSIGARIHKHANMIMELQHSASLNSKSVGQFEKMAYMIVGSIFAAVAYFVFESLAH